MKVTKISEIYHISDDNDNRIILNINYKENNFEIFRLRVKNESNIIQEAEKFANEKINEWKNTTKKT